MLQCRHPSVHGLELGTSGAVPLVLYTNTQARLRVDGITGKVTVSGSINAKYQDVAERVPSSEQLSVGTAVVLDSTKANQSSHLRLATTCASPVSSVNNPESHSVKRAMAKSSSPPPAACE